MKYQLPRKQNENEVYSFRTFPKTLIQDDLKWYSHNEDREFLFLHDSDWMFQIEGDQPIRIDKNLKILISEGQTYRILKGTEDLKVRVLKLNRIPLLPRTQKA